MTANREFDLSEMSFAKFATQVTRADADLIGLPVICSRLFRFSSFYVNRKSGIERVEDLYGKTRRQPGMGAFGGGLDPRLDAERSGNGSCAGSAGCRPVPMPPAARRRSS